LYGGSNPTSKAMAQRFQLLFAFEQTTISSDF